MNQLCTGPFMSPANFISNQYSHAPVSQCPEGSVQLSLTMPSRHFPLTHRCDQTIPLAESQTLVIATAASSSLALPTASEMTAHLGMANSSCQTVAQLVVHVVWTPIDNLCNNEINEPFGAHLIGSNANLSFTIFVMRRSPITVSGLLSCA